MCTMHTQMHATRWHPYVFWKVAEPHGQWIEQLATMGSWHVKIYGDNRVYGGRMQMDGGPWFTICNHRLMLEVDSGPGSPHFQ